MKDIIRTEKGRKFVKRVKEAGKITYEEINKELAANFPTEKIEELINLFLDEGIKILNEAENKTKAKTKAKSKSKAKVETKAKSKTKEKDELVEEKDEIKYDEEKELEDDDKELDDEEKEEEENEEKELDEEFVEEENEDSLEEEDEEKEEEDSKSSTYSTILVTEQGETKANSTGDLELDTRRGEIYIPGSTLKGLFRDRFATMYKDNIFVKNLFGYTEENSKEEKAKKNFGNEKKLDAAKLLPVLENRLGADNVKCVSKHLKL